MKPRPLRLRRTHLFIHAGPGAIAGCAAFPLAAFTDPRTRGEFKKWRDKLGEKSARQGHLTWTVLCKAVSWGFDSGLVGNHPFLRAGKLYRGARVDHVWSDEDEKRSLASAPEVLRLPFLLALYTGQRQGDLLRLPWNAYDGEQIKLTQSKTGKTIKVRAAGPLKAALDAAFKVKKGLIIRVDEDGRPFSRDAFKGR